VNKKVRNILQKIAIILVVATAAILIISAVEKKEDDNVSNVFINIEPLNNGKTMIDSLDILTTIERSFGFKLESQKIGIVNIERVERIIEDEAFVKDAEVFMDTKNRIHISIKQREPILRYFDENGKSFYLDTEGQKMPTSKHYSARVLVATGDIPPHEPTFMVSANGHILKDLYYLTQYIRANDFWNSMIEQVHVKRGEFILIPKVGKQKIQFGKFEKIENKFRRLRKFYEEGMSRVGWRKYRTIDVRFDGQVIGRK
jgi:cell division protein FtsQ